jgi:hypothetical protein
MLFFFDLPSHAPAFVSITVFLVLDLTDWKNHIDKKNPYTCWKKNFQHHFSAIIFSTHTYHLIVFFTTNLLPFILILNARSSLRTLINSDHKSATKSADPIWS